MVQVNSSTGTGKTSLELFYGIIKAKVKKLSTETIQVRTPVAVAAVRGTEFAVVYENEDTTELEVYDGKVSIAESSDITKADEVIVSKDHWADVKKGKKPTIQGKIEEMRALKWDHFSLKKSVFENLKASKKLNMEEIKYTQMLRVTMDPQEKEQIEKKLKKITKDKKKAEKDYLANSKQLKDAEKKYAELRKKDVENRFDFILKQKKKQIEENKENILKQRKKIKDKKSRIKKKGKLKKKRSR
jgi:hypothetical protein